jgi:hypothetical protein
MKDFELILGTNTANRLRLSNMPVILLLAVDYTPYQRDIQSLFIECCNQHPYIPGRLMSQKIPYHTPKTAECSAKEAQAKLKGLQLVVHRWQALQLCSIKMSVWLYCPCPID